MPATLASPHVVNGPLRQRDSTRRNIRALVAATFLTRAAGFTYPFLPYLLAEKGQGSRTIGITLAAFGLGWLVGSVLWGWLADGIGRRAALVTAMVLGTVVFPLVAWTDRPGALLAAVLAAGILYDAPRPVFTAAIADLAPDGEERAALNARRNYTVNVAAAAAGAAGGLLAGPAGIGTLITLNAAACALSGIIAWHFIDIPHKGRQARESDSHRDVLRDHRLWLLVLTSLAALTCCASLFSALPLIMADRGLTVADYAWTQAANAAAVLAMSPLLNRWLTRKGARPQPMTDLLAAGSLMLGVSLVAAALATNLTGYALAAAAAVPGEVVVFAAAADILNRIAPAESRGVYAGVWGTTLAVAVIIAPLAASWALQTGGPLLVATTMAFSATLGAILCRPLAVAVKGRSAAS
ncbi:MFS transporter [Streptomyces erythrochromogenes]|uniref:MFS transporter n=1 Tax=Streptomyces erythrochromogenes TaxID=285574 RepID=UPI00341EB170